MNNNSSISSAYKLSPTFDDLNNFLTSACPVSGKNIEKIYEDTLEREFPYVALWITDNNNAQTLCDGLVYSDFYARTFKNYSYDSKALIHPLTGVTVKEIKCLALKIFGGIPSVISHIKVSEDDSDKIYFSYHYLKACDKTNPFAYQSIAVLIDYYDAHEDQIEKRAWQKRCYQVIKDFYGKGAALFSLNYIFGESYYRDCALPIFLDPDVKSLQGWDPLFKGSCYEKNTENIFKTGATEAFWHSLGTTLDKAKAYIPAGFCRLFPSRGSLLGVKQILKEEELRPFTSNPVALVVRALMLKKLGKPDNAEECLKRARAIAPNYVKRLELNPLLM
jgi:hypothetical protein